MWMSGLVGRGRCVALARIWASGACRFNIGEGDPMEVCLQAARLFVATRANDITITDSIFPVLYMAICSELFAGIAG